jgi:hypothetical protein
MKVAIIGTRGIPNNYSGFEQFAENFAVFLVEEGYDITVYNSHNHYYQKQNYKGVKIIHCFNPEFLFGTFGQFIYDLNCILNTRRQRFDVILQLGYTSNSIWYFLLPKAAKIVTNMDGLEWKRTKYTPLVQKFLKYAEKLAVKSSDVLIADSLGIQTYLKKKYGLESTYIPYGANIPEHFQKSILEDYNVRPFSYDMLIARMEPENNIEVILDGHCASNQKRNFFVIGNHQGTKYGKYIYKKFKDTPSIYFLGGIFDLVKLNALRKFSSLYFHGHSVGGTNPSLLEAMASEALIVAHDNLFNKGVLGEDAHYFTDVSDVTVSIDKLEKKTFSNAISNNTDKIRYKFSWKSVNTNYLKTLVKVYQSS